MQKFSSSPGIVTGFEFLNVHPVRLGAISSGENVLISFLEYFVGKRTTRFSDFMSNQPHLFFGVKRRGIISSKVWVCSFRLWKIV